MFVTSLAAVQCASRRRLPVDLMANPYHENGCNEVTLPRSASYGCPRLNSQPLGDVSLVPMGAVAAMAECFSGIGQ